MTAGYVLFRMGEQVFATGLDDIREIVRLQGLARLPGTRPPMAGMIELRGVPLPVVDPRGEAGVGGDVLVVDAPGGPLGVAVDAVVSVVPAEELPAPPVPPPGTLPGYVSGVHRGPHGPVLLVDLPRLIEAIGGESTVVAAAD